MTLAILAHAEDCGSGVYGDRVHLLPSIRLRLQADRDDPSAWSELKAHFSDAESGIPGRMYGALCDQHMHRSELEEPQEQF